MLAIWNAVQEEKHRRGAKSIRQACERLYARDFLVKFVDGRTGEILDVIKGEGGAETLRQRYQRAERCRHDAERYPLLHARTEQLEREFLRDAERNRAEDDEHRRWLMVIGDQIF